MRDSGATPIVITEFTLIIHRAPSPMSNFSELWEALESAMYTTAAGVAFARYLYNVTKSELRKPVDVFNILLNELDVKFDEGKFGNRAAERAALDIFNVLLKWLRYLRDEGYVVNFFTKSAFIIDDGVEGGTVEVTVEMPSGVKWTVEITMDGAQIKSRLTRIEARCTPSQN